MNDTTSIEAPSDRMLSAWSISQGLTGLDLFKEFLQGFYKDNTDEEAFEEWERSAREAPEYANDLLFGLESVAANPPENLYRILVDDGWVVLHHRPENPEAAIVPYNYEETLAWVRSLTERCRAIFDQLNRGDRAPDT